MGARKHSSTLDRYLEEAKFLYQRNNTSPMTHDLVFMISDEG